MVIDTSAIVAIALNEVDAADIERLIVDDPIRLISAATVLEATMVIETSRRVAELWRLLFLRAGGDPQ